MIWNTICCRAFSKAGSGINFLTTLLNWAQLMNLVSKQTYFQILLRSWSK
jgi:hypothetical protein